MRNDDMLRKSVKNKSRLIPEGYERRLSDLLDSLPDEVPVSSDTEVHVIKHTSRFDIKALVSAAAAFAIVSAAVIAFTKTTNHAFDRNNDKDGKSYVTSVTTTEAAAETTEVTTTTVPPVTTVSEETAVAESTETSLSTEKNDSTDKLPVISHENAVNPVPAPEHSSADGDKPVQPQISGPADNHEHPEPEKPVESAPVPVTPVPDPEHPADAPVPPVPPVTDKNEQPPVPPETGKNENHPVPPEIDKNEKPSIPHNGKPDNEKNEDKSDNRNENAGNRDEHADLPHENEKNNAIVHSSPDENIFGVYEAHR